MLARTHRVALIASLVITAAAVGPAGAMDGFAVAVNSRQKGRLDDREFAFLLQDCASTGLYRYDVSKNAVVKTSRICAYRCLYPAISHDGKRVVFFRQNTKVDPGGKSVGEVDETWHLSVMNTDGTGLRDLVTFGEGVSGRARLDWPIGDWVYYARPQMPETKGLLRVWKVNVESPDRNQLVLDLTPDAGPEARGRLIRWSLNLAGDRTAMRVLGSPYGENHAYAAWPPAGPEDGVATPIGDSYDDNKDDGRIQRCMVQLSPSGKYLATFPREHHRKVMIHQWNFDKNQISPRKLFTANEANNRWLGKKMRGRGHFIRWAVNSDKWICLMYGSELILLNWVDEQAILIPGRGKSYVPRFFRSPGDLWVRGPVGAYETVRGTWARIGQVDAVDDAAETLGLDEKEPTKARSAAKVVPRLRVQAKLVKKTPWDNDVALSSSYPHALIVFRYEVEKVLKGTYEERFIHVAHWAARDRRPIPAVLQRQVGRSYTLEVENLSAHEELESERRLDDIALDLRLPLMLHVGALTK
jgi:hypothetical protein